MESQAIKATYIGGPTILLEIAGLRIMTDPTLDPPGVYDLGHIQLEKFIEPAKANIEAIDVVLLSHDQHHDNLDNKGRALLGQVSRVYSTQAAAKRLGGATIGMLPWESHVIKTPTGDELTITATPARHGPAGIEKISGDVIGFILSVKGKSTIELYITGDTVYYEGIAEVAKRFEPSYVFAFAGAAKPKGSVHMTMSANDVIDTAFAFPEVQIIPMHHEGWKHYTQNSKELETAFAMVGIEQRLKFLKPGVEQVL